jgi:hypothetical protein
MNRLSYSVSVSAANGIAIGLPLQPDYGRVAQPLRV